MSRIQFFILAAIILAAGFTGGFVSSAFYNGEPATAQEDDTVTATSLNIVDANGTPRIMLTTSQDGNATPLAMILDEKGNPLQVYGLTDKDEPTFSIMDKDGVVRAGGASMDAEGPALFMNDKSDKTIWGAP